jgi:polar amino acid transport system ATP-binding protein
MTAAPPPVLRIQALHKRYGSHHVLRGIDLDVLPGDRIAIIGSSGSGKSTLLRCLNFMEVPSAGQVVLKGRAVGRPVPGSDTLRYGEAELSEVRKQVGMVFQQFNLFPHMTVLQNVMEGLVTVKRLPAAEARERALAEIAKVGLAEKAAAYPGHLSGGQQQRVAIARALAMEPEVLLFDEPTSSLDPELTDEVLGVMRELADDGTTMIVVTHEMGFAREVSDRVMFLHNGLIEEEGPPAEVFAAPKSERFRQFISKHLRTAP